jgi:hypothetical protein
MRKYVVAVLAAAALALAIPSMAVAQGHSGSPPAWGPGGVPAGHGVNPSGGAWGQAVSGFAPGAMGCHASANTPPRCQNGF